MLVEGVSVAGAIPVLVAEALPLVRHGLVAALSEDPEIAVVAAVDDGLAAVDAARRLHPRVVLMGSQSQQATGSEGTRRIKAALPDVHVLVMGPSEKDPAIFAAIEAGAIGYVPQDIAPRDLRRAVLSVCNGMAMLQSRVMRKMVDRLTLFSGTGTRRRATGLTEREREVLLAIAEGCSDKEIARQISVTGATAKSYIRSIFQKTGAMNRAHAVTLGFRMGVIR